MQDNIVQKKKEIKRYAKNKGLTRMESYTFIENIIKNMEPIERKILYKELLRDKDSNKTLGEIRELCVLAMSILAIIVPLFFSQMDLGMKMGIEMNTSVDYFRNAMSELYIVILIYYCMIIFLNVTISNYKDEKMQRTQYIIDIFEDVECFLQP